MRVLIVDGANVVGSRPTGWWRDRAGAAKRLHQAMAATDLGYDAVVLVLEGDAKRGQPVGDDGTIFTVHAPGSGDDAIVEQVRTRSRDGTTWWSSPPTGSCVSGWQRPAALPSAPHGSLLGPPDRSSTVVR